MQPSIDRHNLIQLYILFLSVVVGCIGVGEKKLFDYVRKNGGYIHEGISVEKHNNLRGIYANKEIDAGTKLTEIPWNLTASGKDQCDCVYNLHIELIKGKESTIWPYLQTMSSYAPGQPMNWHDEAFEYVKQLPPYDYKRHLEWLKTDCRGNLEQYGRALELYIGRGVGDPNQGFAMVPIYDLFNHGNANNHNTRITYDFGINLAMYATNDIKKGEQLFNSYGEGTPELFRDYGFVEPYPQLWDLGNGIRFRLVSTNKASFSQLNNRPRTREDFIQRVSSLHNHLLNLQIPQHTNKIKSTLPALAQHATQFFKSFTQLGQFNLTHTVPLSYEDQLDVARAYRAALLHAIETAANALPVANSSHDPEDLHSQQDTGITSSSSSISLEDKNDEL